MKLIESSEQLLKLILIETYSKQGRNIQKTTERNRYIDKKIVKKGEKNIEAYMYVY